MARGPERTKMGDETRQGVRAGPRVTYHDATAETGAMTVIPRSHTQRSMRSGPPCQDEVRLCSPETRGAPRHF